MSLRLSAARSTLSLFVSLLWTAGALAQPQLRDDAVTLTSHDAVEIPVLENDVFEGPGNFLIEVTEPPSHGGAEVVVGGVRYTPGPGPLVADSFVYQVRLPNFPQALGEATVRLAPPAAQANNDEAEVDAGRSVEIYILENDELAGASVQTVRLGDVEPTAGRVIWISEGAFVRFDASAAYAGWTTFDYLLQLTSGAEITATVTVAVSAESQVDPEGPQPETPPIDAPPEPPISVVVPTEPQPAIAPSDVTAADCDRLPAVLGSWRFVPPGGYDPADMARIHRNAVVASRDPIRIDRGFCIQIGEISDTAVRDALPGALESLPAIGAPLPDPDGPYRGGLSHRDAMDIVEQLAASAPLRLRLPTRQEWLAAALAADGDGADGRMAAQSDSSYLFGPLDWTSDSCRDGGYIALGWTDRRFADPNTLATCQAAEARFKYLTVRLVADAPQ